MKNLFVSHQKRLLPRLVLLFSLVLAFAITACGGSTIGSPSLLSNSASDAQAAQQSAKLGAQHCPNSVKNPSHWDAIVGTKQGVNRVESVTCANILGNSSLQALVNVRYSGTGAKLDAYVYTHITSSSPSRLFSLKGLYKGDAKISGYNTVITAEVNQKNLTNANASPDLFREFKWSNGAGTLVPVSFPGFYPDMTRYQAVADQAQVNEGHQPWKLDAAKVAKATAVALLNWSTSAQTTIVSGGGAADVNAVVNVKSTNPVATTIKVTLSRLYGNTHNLWEAIAVGSYGMSITSPQSRARITSPTTVTGTGNAFEAVIGRLTIRDHAYNDIGHATVIGASGEGNTTFSTGVSFDASFQGAVWNGVSGTGPQEGIVVLSAESGVGGPPAAVIVKELLGA